MQKGQVKTKTVKTSATRSIGSDFFKSKSGFLTLADGASFEGIYPCSEAIDITGEVVFNTGMTGYIESLTDPSYTNQILVFTYPLIGNYGVQPDSAESPKIQVAGVIVSEAAAHFSHSGAEKSLLDWLNEQNVPLLAEVDTRALTKHLRVHGTTLGTIAANKQKPEPGKMPPKLISVEEPTVYHKGAGKKVILVDCGSKENILRSLLKYPLEVKRVPAGYDYTNEDYDGVVLSNGPGDPTDYQLTVEVTKKALKKGKPVFGICLGSQVMGLAAGAKTYKLKFGHRGHNQPCVDGNNKGYITSQNHGYAIDEKSLPAGWLVSFRNLNDDSVEGIRHSSKPFFSVQFHPEACPGPTDTAWLFKEFFDTL